LSVSDSGPGISPVAQQTLFKPFTQVDGSTTRRHGGVGLGLAISKRLAELMDGEVGAISKPGLGSTFFLQLSTQIRNYGDVFVDRGGFRQPRRGFCGESWPRESEDRAV